MNTKSDTSKKSSLYFPLWFCISLSLLVKSAYVLDGLYMITFATALIYSVFALLPILFFVSFSFLFHERRAKYYLLSVNVILSLVLFIDIMYSRAYGRLPSVYMLGAVSVLDGLSDSILSILRFTDILFVIDLPLIYFFSRKGLIRTSSRKILLFLLTCTLSILASVLYNHSLDESKFRGNRNNWPLALSPIGTHIYEISQIVLNQSVELTETNVSKIEQWFAQNAVFLPGDKQYQHLFGSLGGNNLLVIQIESLENFVIGQEVWGHEITPHINRLLNESYYFPNLIAQTADGNSSDAELLFNTSIYPLSSGSTFLRYAENQYNALPIILAKSGYTSLAIHGDDKEYWNRYITFPKMGFSDYIDETHFSSMSHIGMGIDDEILFKDSYQILSDLQEPYYFYAITMTSHMPFGLPSEKKGLRFEEDTLSTDYLNSIHYVDQQFGLFYERLKDEGLLENTTLVLYGDHEGIHKSYDTDLPENHGKIPFIIHSLGTDGQIIDKPGGQVDMLPTLLYLLGIDQTFYENSVMGRNLFGQYSGSPITIQGEIVARADRPDLLLDAQEIADLSITGNYFERMFHE